jgi:integrase
LLFSLLKLRSALASFKTVMTYIDKFNQRFGDAVVGDIKPVDLENLQEARKKEGLKPKTVDVEINYVKTMVIKAFDNDLLGGDVLIAFRRVKKTLKAHSNRRDRVLTVQEFHTLYDKAQSHIKGILAMGYWCGMRKGEIINLTWHKVDLKARIIRLEAADTKERQPKTIPISNEVYKVLARIPRPIHGGHVFLYYSKPITKRFETAMKTTCKDAGIPWGREVKGGFIFHDLRHTFITDMRRAGVPRTATMSITGHAISDMNERYDTVDEADKLEAIRLFEKLRNASQSATQKKPFI